MRTQILMHRYNVQLHKTLYSNMIMASRESTNGHVNETNRQVKVSYVVGQVTKLYPLSSNGSQDIVFKRVCPVSIKVRDLSPLLLNDCGNFQVILESFSVLSSAFMWMFLLRSLSLYLLPFFVCSFSEHTFHGVF